MAALRTHAGLGALALPEVVSRAALHGRISSVWNPETRLYDYYLLASPTKGGVPSRQVGLGLTVEDALPELPPGCRRAGSGERPLGHVVRRRARERGMLGGLGWMLGLLLPIVPP